MKVTAWSNEEKILQRDAITNKNHISGITR
jgi:hypothetical protein